MERVVDKAIVLICCLACFAVLPWRLALLLALLCAVVVAASSEVLPPRFAAAPALAYVLAALIWPSFGLFLALAVYDLARSDHPVVRACWIPSALSGAVRLDAEAAMLMALASGLALLLSLRTKRFQEELDAYRRLRDNVQESSLALEEKNRGLRERQDLEVKLATLAERGRIAREIHDNVGHLLTRSIMQVEALQVVHRDEEQVRSELAQVGGTLHEAMSTVRASVHDLHDDAFDLETQIRDVARSCATLAVDIDYRAEDVPSDVGACFIAIVREALSNAARHGDATRASVSVASYPAFFRLLVHDDGSVPPPPEVLGEAPRIGRGIGLSTMADRARALGGRCRVDYDRGFKVFVTVPKGDAS